MFKGVYPERIVIYNVFTPDGVTTPTKLLATQLILNVGGNVELV